MRLIHNEISEGPELAEILDVPFVRKGVDRSNQHAEGSGSLQRLYAIEGEVAPF